MKSAFKTKPFDHQLRNLQARKGRVAFADLSEQGTGKTWAQINEGAMLFGAGSIDGILVVAPKGVHMNWTLIELPKHMPDWVSYRAVYWTNNKSKKAQAKLESIFNPAKERTLRILAVNWDILQYKESYKFIERFCNSCKSVLVVGDEAHKMKNPKSERAKAMNRLKESGCTAYRRAMTGTPVLQGPFDIFAIFNWLDETILETTSFYAFKAEYAELLQPGNALLDHIVGKKRKLSKESRGELTKHLSHLSTLLANNGRGDLLALYDDMFASFELEDWLDFISKAEKLRTSFDPKSTSAKKFEALRHIQKAEIIASDVVRKASKPIDPRRMPQIVAKGKGGAPKYRNLDKLERIIKPHSFRVLKKECLDLPDKVYTQTWFELSPKQGKAYDLMKEEARMILSDGNITPVAKLATVMKLSQICSGFIMEPVTKKPILIEEEMTPKLDLLEDRLLTEIETGGQVIVWARFVEEIEQIKQLCKKNDWPAASYDGRTKGDERPKIVAAFEAGELKVFIGQQQAGATGITLIAATRVIYYSNTFSLGDRLQSEDRAHRIGQKKTVVYEDLLGIDTIDIKIVNALRNKQNVSDLITGDAARLLDAA